MLSSKNEFLSKLENKTACIGVLGLGYVGIPLAKRISEIGLKVIGFDVLEKRILQLNSGESPIEHISNENIQTMVDSGFVATDDFSNAAQCDALILCVPTPLNSNREPDLSFVIATMEQIKPYLRKGQLLSLESTTWPGTTDEKLLPYFSALGLEAGKDCFLVYSPEREDPGNPNFTTRTIPKVVGGHTKNCLEAGEALYGLIVDEVVSVSSTRASEMVKLLENIHRSVNIGLVNELKIVADKMGLDIFEIIDAAKTKPFGFTAYYPGPGIGGHCIPIDPFYLTWKAREFGVNTRFIELAGEINASMPQYVVNKIASALNEKSKALKGSKVLVLGVAYKGNVDDVRESPSVIVMEHLRDLGCDLSYSDPHVPVFPEMRKHKFKLESVELTPSNIASYDVVVLLTAHKKFDYDLIAQHAKLIVDTRGKFTKTESVISA